MTKRPASESKAYTSFILERDKALERLYLNAQRKIDDELRATFTRVIEMIAYRYGTIPKDQVKTNRAKYALTQIEASVNQEFGKTAHAIELIYKTLKRQAYLLASVGEAEAVSRATGKPTAVHINDHELRHLADKTSQGHDVSDRILHSLTVVSRNLMSSIEYARIRGENRDDLIPRLLRALPRTKRFKRARRALKQVTREAEPKKKEFPVSVQAYIPEQEWQAMVADYADEYIPETRGPEYVYDMEPKDGIGDELEERYGWDLERELANDFVSSVRSGQNETANQNGIVDFSVIAVIDSHTCDDCCDGVGCVDFDGKTTAEIEQMTDGAQSAPPFHFNCRCTMAPMLDNMPELEQSNEEDFRSWLNS